MKITHHENIHNHENLLLVKVNNKYVHYAVNTVPLVLKEVLLFLCQSK